MCPQRWGAVFILGLLLVASGSIGAHAWENSHLALARQLLNQGLVRSSYTLYADVARRSENQSVRADCLEMMAALSLKLGDSHKARTLLDQTHAMRARALLAEHSKRRANADNIDEPVVRVLLAKKGSITIKLSAACRDATGKVLLTNGTTSVAIAQGKLYLDSRPSGQRLKCRPSNDVFQFNNRDYAGDIQISAIPGQALLVNAVPLETYLLGVVPAEMPASWDAEALRAQAVAARTYAMHRMRSPRSPMYDVADDETDQVYTGLARRTPSTDHAVRGTHGRILTHSGEPILAMYHAHSGGSLDSSAGPAHPYLRGGPDPSSVTKWKADWELRAPAALFAAHGSKRILSIRAADTTRGGRVRSFSVHTEQGEHLLTRRQLSARLAPRRLPSGLCSVRLEGSEVVLTGRGYGHGMGMSQWGAQGLAEAGSSMQDILRHYYPGAKLVAAYP
jgi:stage II sporulation protein D